MTPEPPAVGENPSPALPPRTKFLWSWGGVGDWLIYNGVTVMLQQTYVSALAMKPLLFSVAVSAPRFIDVVLDPLIGHWSDNTRTRWGRRKPWMFWGAILSGLLVALVWHPPLAWGATAVFVFLMVVMSLLFSGGYSSYVIAHTAMGYEMTNDYNERTHLFKWRLCAMSAAGFISPWFPRLCLYLEGDKAEILKGAEGAKWVGAFLGLAIVITGLIPVFFCPEGPGSHRQQPKVPLGRAVRLTLSNRPFWLLVISNIITKFGMSVTGVFCFYVITYYVGGGSLTNGTWWWGIFVNAINISAFFALWGMAWLTERIGKKSALLWGLAISGIVYASALWTMTPKAPWLCIIFGICIGVFTNPLPMVKNSMLADVCDYDELQSGYRREAFYGAVFVTSDKLAMAVSLACQGLVLGWSGFNALLPSQSLATIHYWLLAIVLTQPLGFFIGLLTIAVYPLSRARCAEIRRQLDERRRITSLPFQPEITPIS